TNDRIAIQNRREMCVLEQISQRSIKNHLDFEPFLRNLLHTTKRTSGDLASSVTIRQPTRGDLACRMTRLRRSVSSSQNDSENRAPRSIGPRATFIQRGFKAMRYYCPDLQALPGPIKAGMPRCPRRDTRRTTPNLRQRKSKRSIIPIREDRIIWTSNRVYAKPIRAVTVATSRSSTERSTPLVLFPSAISSGRSPFHHEYVRLPSGSQTVAPLRPGL